MAIQVVVDGNTYRTDDLTLDEACEIEQACGTSWVNINPFRSAKECRAIIVAFLTRERGAEEARKFAGCLSVTETLDAVTIADDDRPNEFEDGVPLPKAEAETATTGSSSARTVTAGPPT